MDSKIFKEQLAERLRDAMLERGQNQKELTASAGIAGGLVSRILAGERLPQLDTVLRIADSLSIDASWLAFGVGQMEPSVLGEPGPVWHGVAIETQHAIRFARYLGASDEAIEKALSLLDPEWQKDAKHVFELIMKLHETAQILSRSRQLTPHRATLGPFGHVASGETQTWNEATDLWVSVSARGGLGYVDF